VILTEVAVLVYAYRREAGRHEQYAVRLADVVGGAEELALVEATLTGRMLTASASSHLRPGAQPPRGTARTHPPRWRPNAAGRAGVRPCRRAPRA